MARNSVQPSGGYLSVDGDGRIFCEVAGSGSSIVLIHDGLLHRETWDAQFGVFAQRFRVIRWDRRGYGLSDLPDAPYSSVDDLVQVLRSFSDSPATLVGCSFGGLLSLHCALDYPELVAALVLVGPIVSGLGYTEHFVTRGGQAPPEDAGAAREIEYWSRQDRWIVSPGSSAARERLRALLLANPQNLLPKAQLELRPRTAALPRLSEILTPTLIVAGEYDIADVHAHCGALEAGISSATRIVLAGCGHLPHFEVPDAFNKAVLDFLGQVREQRVEVRHRP
jgi:3-oxoadipate enol-lactonase